MLGYTLWKYVNHMWRRFCVVYTLTIQLKEVLFFFTSRIFLFLCPCFLPSYPSFLTKLFIIAFKHNHWHSNKTFWHFHVSFLINIGGRIRSRTQSSSLWNLCVAITPFCYMWKLKSFLLFGGARRNRTFATKNSPDCLANSSLNRLSIAPYWWEGKDLNFRNHKVTDLQSACFSHLHTFP